MIKGIDVSEHQGDIDWNKVKNTGIKFAILRTGYGSASIDQIDKSFYDNLEGANSTNCPLGAYHYGYATSVNEAQNEAQFCIDILGNANMPYCVWYDVEEQSMLNCGVQELTNIINAFCQTVENAGYKAGVYMSSSHAQKYVDMSQIPYYKWIAQYNSTLDYPEYCDIWQYSSSERIDGIYQNSVDVNYCYTDFIADTQVLPIKYEWEFYKDQQKWAVKCNGEWVYDRWIEDIGKWYRIDKDGWLLQIGWYKEGESWYYIKPENGEMFIGWFWDKNNQGWYYLDENGRLVQDGWKWDSDTDGWYYLKSDGKMAIKEYVHAPEELSRYWTNENGKWQK